MLKFSCLPSMKSYMFAPIHIKSSPKVKLGQVQTFLKITRLASRMSYIGPNSHEKLTKSDISKSLESVWTFLKITHLVSRKQHLVIIGPNSHISQVVHIGPGFWVKGWVLWWTIISAKTLLGKIFNMTIWDCIVLLTYIFVYFHVGAPFEESIIWNNKYFPVIPVGSLIYSNQQVWTCNIWYIYNYFNTYKHSYEAYNIMMMGDKTLLAYHVATGLLLA